MLKSLLGLIFRLILSTSINAQILPKYGKLVRLNIKSKYIPSRPVDVWLPNNYDTTKRYAVIYMHDGQMLFDSTNTWNKQEWKIDETATRLQDSNRTQPFIVVGIHNISDLRYAEYYPKKTIQYLPDSIARLVSKEMKAETNADAYLQFIVNELKPQIDKEFSTDTLNYIGGSSMGGLISWYALCEYPQIFKGAMCLSTHWPGGKPTASHAPFLFNSFVKYLQLKLPDSETHKIYFDHGTLTLDSFYRQYQMVVNGIARQKSYNSTSMRTMVFKMKAHDEKSWAERMYIPLEFMLANRKEEIKKQDN